MFHSLLLLIGILLGSCDSHQESLKDEWAYTTATITQVEYDAAYGYMYTLEYATPESIAVNQKGEKITGPVQQHALDKNKPILNQQILLQYLKEEPIMFKLLKPIEFEKTH
ncbi:MAG: hypothetical protein ACK4V2_01080 [Pseudomonadota bacterium]|jgi:hypothetical protein|nr:hypothetical protein [Alphaproteobacteria bacterium]